MLNQPEKVCTVTMINSQRKRQFTNLVPGDSSSLSATTLIIATSTPLTASCGFIAKKYDPDPNATSLSPEQAPEVYTASTDSLGNGRPDNKT
jgi:hypothetical protein